MGLEQDGIPTVAVHTNIFARLCKATALSMGIPRLRQAYVPQPVVDRSPSDLRAYIDGTDPVSHRPFMQEVLDGLTSPLEEADLQGVSFERTTPRLLEPDTEDHLQRLFEENHWTDFLPVILPTEARVEAMLKGTSHPPDKIVGRLRPTAFREFWEFTVEKVAVNAVMAGARPEDFPVILALAASGITMRSSSTNSFATMAVVNGPIRNELGMNSGIGAMGRTTTPTPRLGAPTACCRRISRADRFRAKATWVARQLVLVYGCPPRGRRAESVAAAARAARLQADRERRLIFFGGWYTHAGYGPRATWKEKMRHMLAAVEQYSPPLVVMDPIAARGFVDLGFDTKDKLIDWLSDNGVMTAREYWDNQWTQYLMKPRAAAGVEPYASKLRAEPDEIIKIFEPSEINIVVAGGETQGAWKMIGGSLRAKVSIDAWR